MATSLGKIVVQFVGDTKGLERSAKKVKTSLGGVEKQAKKTKTGITNMGAGMKAAGGNISSMGTALTAVGAIMGVIAFKAVGLALTFDKEMTKIETLVGVQPALVGEWRQSLTDLAPAVGISTGALAQAMFVVTSAGIRSAKAFDIVKASAEGSAIGMGETSTVARAVTSAMQAYSSSGLTASSAMDIMTNTVKEGNLESSALAGSLGRVIGIAGQVGVSFDEVGAFVATYTRLGVSAEEATTALRGVMSSIISPTTEAAGAMAILKQSIKEKGLAQALVDLTTTYKGNEEELAKIIPNIRALAGVMGTAGVQSDAYLEVQNNITNGAGVLQEAMERLQQSPAFKFEQAKESVNKLFQAFGESLVPVIEDLIKNTLPPLLAKLKSIIEWFTGLSTGVQSFLVIAGGITVILGPVLLIFGAMVTAAGSLVTAVAALGITWAGTAAVISTTVLPILAALAVGIAAFAITDWVLEWTGLRDILNQVVDWLVRMFTTVETTAPQMDVLALASQIAGEKITDLSEAIRIVTEDNMRMQEETQKNAKATGNLGGSAGGAAGAVAALHAGLMLLMPTFDEMVLAAQRTDEQFEFTQQVMTQTGAGAGTLADVMNNKALMIGYAFERLGMKTRAESQATLAQMLKDYNAVEASGLATTAQLEAAWKSYLDAKAQMEGESTTFTKTQGAQLVADSLSSFAKLGGKFKVFAIAGAIISTYLSITKSLAEYPWPFSLVAAAAAAAAGFANVAKIKSSKSHRFGTPDLDYAPFGTGTPATLHGQEAVIPQGGGHKLAQEIAIAQNAPSMGVPDISPAGAGGSGGGPTMVHTTIVVDGREIVKAITPAMEKASKAGSLRTYTQSVRKF